MYFFLTITQLLKTFNPYFRKHILESLEMHEYLFINTFFITCFVFLYFLYKFFFHNKFIDTLTNKILNLTIIQVIYFMFIAFITVFSSIVLIQLDKKHNTPLINGLLTKVISVILLLIISIFMFKEKYNYKQIVGIFLTVLGLYLTTHK